MRDMKKTKKTKAQKKPTTTRAMRPVLVRMSASTIATVDKLAKSKKWNRSQLIRAAVVDYLTDFGRGRIQ